MHRLHTSARTTCARHSCRTFQHHRPKLITAPSSRYYAMAANTKTTVSAPTSGPSPESAASLAHHAKSGFQNPWPSFSPVSWAMIRHLMWNRLTASGWSAPKGQTVPVRKPSFLPSRDTPTLRATWLGHACYYVEFPNGLRVLFDPVFTGRCSPFSWLGPQRYTDMPCTVKDIPYVDAVVISHSHYDHLSLPTIREIQTLHPEVRFFAPLGNKKWFESCGLRNTTELDWWQDVEITVPTSDAPATPMTAQISCLPSQHTSNRTPFNRDQTLWASWAVKSGGKNLYFAGDTGYRQVPILPHDQDLADYDLSDSRYPHCPAFADIGRLRGPFDLGLIPIGAYSPRFFMSGLHANPFDSVNISRDTACKRALAMHWGTWVLTNEDVLEPARLLKAGLAAKGTPETGVFDVCDIGESREF